MSLTYLFSAAGSLLFAGVAILVVIAAMRRYRRQPCWACGLSIASGLDECPYCHERQR